MKKRSEFVNRAPEMPWEKKPEQKLNFVQVDCLNFIYSIAGRFAESLPPTENLALSTRLATAYSVVMADDSKPPAPANDAVMRRGRKD